MFVKYLISHPYVFLENIGKYLIQFSVEFIKYARSIIQKKKKSADSEKWRRRH